MHRIRPDVDIIMDVLTATLKAQPHSTFVASLLRQYQERGGLSKKQLEGLYQKAGKIKDIPPAKMATLQAIILKKHTKHRSDLPENKPLFEKDAALGGMLDAILEKYPQHKRVLYLKAQYDENKPFTIAATEELKRFYKLLIEPSK